MAFSRMACVSTSFVCFHLCSVWQKAVRDFCSGQEPRGDLSPDWTLAFSSSVSSFSSWESDPSRVVKVCLSLWFHQSPTLICVAACLLVDPCPLSGRWLHLKGSITPVFHRRGKRQMMDTWKMLFLFLYIYVGGAMLEHVKYSEFVRIRTRVPMFRKAIFDVSPGMQESLFDISFLHKFPSKRNNHVKRLTQNNDNVCLQEIHGKDDFLQAIQVIAPRFRLYGTFTPNNANAGGSAFCVHQDLLPDEHW